MQVVGLDHLVLTVGPVSQAPARNPELSLIEVCVHQEGAGAAPSRASRSGAGPMPRWRDTRRTTRSVARESSSMTPREKWWWVGEALPPGGERSGPGSERSSLHLGVRK